MPFIFLEKKCVENFNEDSLETADFNNITIFAKLTLIFHAIIKTLNTYTDLKLRRWVLLAHC